MPHTAMHRSHRQTHTVQPPPSALQLDGWPDKGPKHTGFETGFHGASHRAKETALRQDRKR